MKFEVVGPIRGIEVIASGTSVRVRSYLLKAYGRGRWRKVKGIATARLPNGALRDVDFPWYAAPAIATRHLKLNPYLDET